MSESYKLPCGCDNTKILMIEYSWDHPEHYDGISEITCTECKRRWGRWTDKELLEGEFEPVYGTCRR